MIFINDGFCVIHNAINFRKNEYYCLFCCGGLINPRKWLNIIGKLHLFKDLCSFISKF